MGFSSSDSRSAKADRACGAILGAFVGDALGLGPHWYYDLQETRQDFGPWISTYTTPKPNRYHAGLQAGELSQTGYIMKLLLRSLAEKGRYVEEHFCRLLDEELLPKLNGTPFSGPGGYTNHSIRQLWKARIAEGKPWGKTGGHADTSEAAERLVLLSARYAADWKELARYSLSHCRLTQTDPLVVQQSVAFAFVVAALVQGERLDGNLSDKILETLEKEGVRLTGEPGEEGSLGLASPDAFLLPSWIAEASTDPEIRMEPAWKVSLLYGMACSIGMVLPAAYYLASRFSSDFEAAILHAVNGGGQNMSRACLTGALVGAQVGLSRIAPRWIEGLREGQEILWLAQKVAEQASGSAG